MTIGRMRMREFRLTLGPWRIHAYGGNGNLWRGFVAPLDDIDCTRRDWIPFSGWPIGKGTIDLYYEVALKFLGCKPSLLRGPVWKYFGGENPLQCSTNLESRFWQFSTLQPFGAGFRRIFQRAGNVRVTTHARVTEIIPAITSNAIECLSMVNSVGRSFRLFSPAARSNTHDCFWLCGRRAKWVSATSSIRPAASTWIT
jgi:hypothetical protein